MDKIFASRTNTAASFCEINMISIRSKGEKNKLFSAEVELRQKYIKYSRLFNIHMNGTVNESKARGVWKKAVLDTRDEVFMGRHGRR